MSDLMLKQFEAWAVIDNQYSIARTYTDLRYDEDDTEDAWYTWQASRECLVVELPEPRAARGYGEQVADALGFNEGINYCEEAIHAAGVKTK